MSFAEQPPSEQWAALTYRGEPFAEVWFKPEGRPNALSFRIPQKSFGLHGLAPLLTPANLLRSVGIDHEEVASWGNEGISATSADLDQPLSLPEQDVDYLHLHFNLKPPAEAVLAGETDGPAISEARWQEMETRWNAILVLEASMDTLRISMEGLRSELDAAGRRALTGDDKNHAMNADVAQWTKAKNRITFALPKAREFIHRATWALGSPDRKKLEELLKNHVRPRIPFAHLDQVFDQLEYLLKDRQVLSAHGVATFQDCKSILAEVQGALRTLQRNAATNAAKKRNAASTRGKFH